MRPARVTVPADPESAQRHQPDAALAFVAGKFGLADYETNAKSAILVDFYLWILMFCKERGFTEEKTSAAFTIVRLTHEFALDGIKTVQEAFGEFKRLVLKHSLVGVKDSVVDSLPASGRMHVRSRSFFLFRDLCRPLAVFALPKPMYAMYACVCEHIGALHSGRCHGAHGLCQPDLHAARASLSVRPLALTGHSMSVYVYVCVNACACVRNQAQTNRSFDAQS